MGRGIEMSIPHALEKCQHICHCFGMDFDNMHPFLRSGGQYIQHNKDIHNLPKNKDIIFIIKINNNVRKKTVKKEKISEKNI